ncbi:MAG: exported protein of unknown function [Nitrospira sp.]|jgi:hypothetical protein|nr:exported protein of unknown function [Nitrospira sp.]
MHSIHGIRHRLTILTATGALLFLTGFSAWAQQNGDKSFHAIATDAKDVQTDLKNVLFYWEEKVSETAFIPHELKHLPVKRGTATVNIKFDGITHFDVKSGAEKSPPTLHITLTNGKTGEFPLAIDGSFKGESDFGKVEMPVNALKKLEFK